MHEYTTPSTFRFTGLPDESPDDEAARAARECDAAEALADWLRVTGSDSDDDRPTPPARLHYPGFLTLSDDDLIGAIAEPFFLPGEDQTVYLSEATAELLRRIDARKQAA